MRSRKRESSGMGEILEAGWQDAVHVTAGRCRRPLNSLPIPRFGGRPRKKVFFPQLCPVGPGITESSLEEGRATACKGKLVAAGDLPPDAARSLHGFFGRSEPAGR